MKTLLQWRPRKLERHEIAWLAVGFVLCATLFAFAELADEVAEGETRTFDEQLLTAVRSADDPSRLLGPPWVESALLDLTAMGGPVVLTLVVAAVAGFLLLQGRERTAVVIVVASASGQLLNELLKELFARPRPDIVPHLREVASLSFPSGHAMQSAIIYLTLGAMLMRIAERRLTKIYCMTIAVLVTFLIGASRVFLGVHYPSDVLGGWMVGFAWACICWIVERRFERQTGVAEERTEADASS